jgi:hypothetical protein
MNINWTNLQITDGDGDSWGSLGALVSSAPANLDSAVISNGKITEWAGFFLHTEDEEPDFDTPRHGVDWDGFAEAIEQARA